MTPFSLRSLTALVLATLAAGAAPQPWSGIYPELAYFNNEGECGTGAVVPLAGRLWGITYGPRRPHRPIARLDGITPDLQPERRR